MGYCRGSSGKDSDMTYVILAALLALVLFLGARWHRADTENARLRREISFLKRRLAER
jgi:hypothetical protein